MIKEATETVVNDSIIKVNAFDNFDIYYTTKNGGVSEGPYAFFNLGLHVEDDNKAVLQNRLKLENTLNKKLVFMDQTHSANVFLVDKDDVSDSKAMLDGSSPISLGVKSDGIVTTNKNLALVVLTADCLPLILVSKDKKAFGAIHCGWKGVYKGVLQSAVFLMRKYSSYDLQAYIGPCIGPNSFEVGPELLDKFNEVIKDASKAFIPKANGKYLCSLPMLVEMTLNKLGIDNIYQSNKDTYKETSLLYSYRQSACTGRMGTIVCFKN